MQPARTLAISLTCSALLLAGCGVAPRLAGAIGHDVPVASMTASSTRVELLEPYDPGRMPVLFVHGIGGSPRDFRAMLDALDRQRFQAWVLHYPTSVRLHAAARAMGRQLADLQRRHGYPRLIIVAHSMGGLVARRYLLDTSKAGGTGAAHALVTLSSPWGGNKWAGIGARMAPAPKGAWIDLAPDSAFLASLRDALPGVPHYVLFGYRRRPSLLASESSDGALTLASQIPEWVQLQAVHVSGYDADHVGILSNASALGRLNVLLTLEAGR